MGGVWTPISKPKRRLIGMSGKELKGVISLSTVSQTSGMKGVLIGNKSCDDGTELGGV